MMNLNKKAFVIFVFSALLIAACSPKIDIAQLRQKADSTYTAGQYDSALRIWQQIIAFKTKKNQPLEKYTLLEAGRSAYRAGKTDTALIYLEKLENTGYENPEMYYLLAQCYRDIDNLSKEIMALEDYDNKFPRADRIEDVQLRLYDTYMESENYALAMELWPEIEQQAAGNYELLKSYFRLNQKLDNTSTVDSLARLILEIEPNDTDALEYLGKKYYRKAENRYNEAHEEYYANQTRTQYNKLLKELEKVTADFKKALEYFKVLYRLDPKPEYANYLGNIYARFDDDEKAKYYHNKAKE
ncbi:MAG: hypothetical protein K9G67_14500 [Bacteroidales bacterium]|nr:hypothetical protein [Bacteroidales bacterium]MCF8343392.1 hypothetical protein [Bacteroidales bacterium]MCF8351761.1 hypothetical protein [Bacteroidales bacterium]MCF8377563.1 hypothetical protein [Bacteroidales bacterium]MCF8401706.1 hypothetical protein [Bacteroidales bacterium]